MLKVSRLGNSIYLYILKFECKMLDILKIKKLNFLYSDTRQDSSILLLRFCLIVKDSYYPLNS